MSKTRKSISVKGLTYYHLRKWCDEHGVGVATSVEKWVAVRLTGQPKVVDLFQISAPQGNSIHVLARDPKKALELAARALKELPTNLRVGTRPLRRDRVTFAHMGIVPPESLSNFLLEGA